jgi:DNA-binding NtrC family response regulator
VIKILVVDDEKDMRDSIGDALECLFPDTEILMAETGREALEKYKNDINDELSIVILNSLKEESISGLELAKRIREASRLTAIIVSSAHSDLSYYNQFAEIGIDGLLIKPFDVDYFEVILRNAMIRIQQLSEFKEYRDQYVMIDRYVKEAIGRIGVINEWINSRVGKRRSRKQFKQLSQFTREVLQH